MERKVCDKKFFLVTSREISRAKRRREASLSRPDHAFMRSRHTKRDRSFIIIKQLLLNRNQKRKKKNLLKHLQHFLEREWLERDILEKNAKKIVFFVSSQKKNRLQVRFFRQCSDKFSKFTNKKSNTSQKLKCQKINKIVDKETGTVCIRKTAVTTGLDVQFYIICSKAGLPLKLPYKVHMSNSKQWSFYTKTKKPSEDKP